MANKLFVRSPYNYDRDKASKVCSLACDFDDPSDNRTQQSFKAECDINEIMRRFGKGAQIPPDFQMWTESDFSTEVSDYQSFMNVVRKADEDFMRLPSALREEFNNDPQRFLRFCTDPKNAPRAREIGLLPPAAVVKAEPVVAVPVAPGATKGAPEGGDQ